MAGTAEGTAFSHLIHNSPVSTRSCLPFSRLGHQGAAIGQLTEAAHCLSSLQHGTSRRVTTVIASETAFTRYVAVFAEGSIQKRKPEANGSEGPKAWRLSFFLWEENPRYFFIYTFTNLQF
uniref:Uncharacterized protein n=1 Tax=Rousettus aegyptiacus TaxID=9407 RepID=A0A7J8FIN6_ROUAE|nr:hypothetical protein HJG63_012010 [Rousettus aegyptiacus]